MAALRSLRTPKRLGRPTMDMLCGRSGGGATMSNADRRWVRDCLRKGPAFAIAAVVCVCLGYGDARADEASAQLTREHLYAGTLGAGAAALAAKINADRT